ncbi:hypothetical protein [Alistipes sp.]|uniref:hypothetical protein n=1 Tax=Alistipes sp. TaxID=1872444 RepID=UPI0025BDD4FC|nr:hypothetical protein [Alistipes sp.]MCI7140533.1 hypothetical protein [Alistipes sp.]
MNPRIIRTILLLFLCITTVSVAKAASTVQGRIYLKDGRVVECSEKDRIKLPKHAQDVKLLRRAFYKDKSKEVYRYEEIDSIVCWHATAPEHPQKFIPAPGVGWLWVYFETPHICVGVFAQKGYGVDSNGGIEVLVKYRSLSRSRTAYYLRKTGETEFYDAGSASRRGKDRFRESVAAYVADDPALAEQILQSETSDRSRTILMLEAYRPEENQMFNN